MHPKNFSHVFSLLSADNKVYVGTIPKSMYFVRRPDLIDKSILSRAFYKIQESVERFDMPISSDWYVLDVGASPGG